MMESIEKLRKWVKSLYTPNSGELKVEGLDIADEIEAEIESRYMLLPVRADGGGQMTDTDRKWYELDAPWDNLREVEGKLMDLGQSREWLELVGETSHLTHATTNEIWNGMARAIVDYLEGLR